jgi:hypothetical protein
MESNELPFFLTDAYDFFEVLLFDKKCLAMIAKSESQLTPAKIRKDWEVVKKKWSGFCFYVQKSIVSHNRLRLIQYQVPFVVPGNQMYLIELGINLQEHFEKQFVPCERFSPATQVVVIYALLHNLENGINPSKLVEKLGYSHMTMSRVFNEIEAAEIGKIVKKGKERWWLFQGSQRDLWEQANTMLSSPVRRKCGRKLIPSAKMWKNPLRSGLSALAELTTLNHPLIPVYATTIEEYESKFGNNGFVDNDYLIETQECELEVWSYNPKLLSEGETVDPFSLYLSLRGSEDERVEGALEEMMEKIKW